MEKHSTEKKNAPRISYKQSDNNWINIDVHSCVLHAALSRSSYNNFVARAALKWLSPLACNTLRVVSVSVIASPLSPGAPSTRRTNSWSCCSQCTEVSYAEDSFAHLPLCCTDHTGIFHSHLPPPLTAWFYSPVDVAVQSLEFGSLSQLPSIPW